MSSFKKYSFQDSKGIELKAKSEELSKAQLTAFTNGNISTERNMFNVAISNMFYSNIAAFITLSEKGNFLAANAVVRMHIDCLLKLFSSFIISPEEDWIKFMLFSDSSQDNKKIKYTNGKKTDINYKFLYQQFEKHTKNKNIEALYKYFCKYVHMTEAQFRQCIAFKAPFKEAEWRACTNINGIQDMFENDVKYSYNAMLQISNEIIAFMKLLKLPEKYRTIYKKFSLIS